MPGKPSKRHRRVFDREIARAVAGWEVLRRTPAYRHAVDAWLKPSTGGRLEHGAVMIDPWDTEARKRYFEDCARFGLRRLVHYQTELTETQMAEYPIFADTPGRQRAPKHEIIRERARQAPAARRGILDLEADFQERKYRDRIRRLERHPDLSERDQQRYFGVQTVPPGPWLRPGRWAHLDSLRWYLRVYDLRRGRIPFHGIAEQLNISVPQAKRAWMVAVGSVDAGPGTDWNDSIGPHLATCGRCRLSPKEAIPDRWCPVGRQLARRAGLLGASLRESLGRKAGAAEVAGGADTPPWR